jgi:Flp pilus assembly protein CpaB
MKQKNVILMVVAVGCGLVAAFLTSQMSAKTNVEQVEVLVAARDLPVGTVITRDDLKDDKTVKTRKLPKDGLPPAFVMNREDLVDKRLSRPIRAEETFNPQDLSKGGNITLPEGYDMVSLQVGVGNAAAGFVGPGSRVNVLATVRMGNKLYAFPLLVNMLIVAVDTQTTYDQKGVFPSMSMVSFAVTEKQALLLSLAKNRGCTLELMLRHPSKSAESDKDYDLEKVIKLLSDEQNTSKIVQGTDAEVEANRSGMNVVPGTSPGTAPGGAKPLDPTKPADPPAASTDTSKPGPGPGASPQTVVVAKVLLAKRDIAPNTPVTADLVKEAFELRIIPVEYAGDALSDLAPAYGLVFKTGVAKNQWVSPSMVGLQESKIPPQEKFEIPKAGPADPRVETVVAPPKRKTQDMAIYTPSGTKVIRYEEVAPGQWRFLAELTPAQAAKEEAPKTPHAAPETKRPAD